jgi:hypothetical protein
VQRLEVIETSPRTRQVADGRKPLKALNGPDVVEPLADGHITPFTTPTWNKASVQASALGQFSLSDDGGRKTEE